MWARLILPAALTTFKVSNISLTDNGKNYFGIYGNDDWKVTNKLTVNLGLRWDFFGLVYDHQGTQANFVPGGPPIGGAIYLIQNGPSGTQLSPSFTCPDGPGWHRRATN